MSDEKSAIFLEDIQAAVQRVINEKLQTSISDIDQKLEEMRFLHQKFKEMEANMSYQAWSHRIND